MDVKTAWSFSFKNKDTVKASNICCCFNCVMCYVKEQVVDWTDDGKTAICPLCGVDSVLGDASGVPMTYDFMENMRKTYFSY